MTQDLAIIILAAGKGTRMHSSKPKVLQPLAGRPWILHLFETTQLLAPKAIYMVVSPDNRSAISAALTGYDGHFIEQKETLGTAHAVLQVLPHIKAQHTLILVGDVPLLAAETLNELITQTPVDAIGMLTFEPEDPHGLGRILRNDEADIVRIVEEKDASSAQKTIREAAVGVYLAPTQLLNTLLPHINNQNLSGEYYLPDLVPLAIAQQIKVKGIKVADPMQAFGINTKNQLAHAERYYQRRLVAQLMQQGLTVVDPARLDIRGDLNVKKDVVIDINVIIEGRVSIGEHCHIGAHAILRNVSIGSHVTIHPYSIIEDSHIADHCTIGPFARIRPGCHIEESARVGNFVELKKSHVGAGSKINHLSYVGDATLGRDVNIGAGTITCNYDGVNKHETQIKNGAFIGSHCALVAPVTVGENAMIGAGTVLTKDAPDQQLTVGRAKQITIERRRKEE